VLVGSSLGLLLRRTACPSEYLAISPSESGLEWVGPLPTVASVLRVHSQLEILLTSETLVTKQSTARPNQHHEHQEVLPMCTCVGMTHNSEQNFLAPSCSAYVYTAQISNKSPALYFLMQLEMLRTQGSRGVIVLGCQTFFTQNVNWIENSKLFIHMISKSQMFENAQRMY